MPVSWRLLVAFGALLLAACGREPVAPAAEPTNASAPAPAASAPAGSSLAADVEAALAAGNAAFREARWYAPPGDNAFEYFLAARTADPGKLAAVEALVELFPLALAGAEAALTAGDWAEAERILALLERAQPDSLAVDRLRERMLSERALAERSAAAAEAERALAADLAAPAAPAPADRDGPAVPMPPAPAIDTAPTAGEVVPAAERAARAARRTSTAPGPASSPPPSAASTAARGSPPVPQASEPAATRDSVQTEPRVLQRVNPEYPPIARMRRIEGYVELEFTVNSEGRAEDIRVVAAEPGGVFDAAATRALMRWRFAPGTRDGQPQPMRSRARIGFRQG